MDIFIGHSVFLCDFRDLSCFDLFISLTMLLEPTIFEALWSSFDKVSRRSSNPPHSVNVYCFFPTLITCKHLHQIENGFLQCIPPGWGSVLLLLNQIFIKTSFLSPTRIVHTCTHQSTFYSVVFCSYGHIC